MLVEDGLMHQGQVKDVLARYSIQEKRILIKRRTELRKAMGRQRVPYTVGEMEIIASFAFPIPNREGKLTEQVITECVARHLSMPFMLLDPLQLDYKMITSTFQGAFAERNMIVPVAKTRKTLTMAVANPFDEQLIESLRGYTGLEISTVLSPKSDITRVIMEFHGFKKSVDAAAKQFRSELTELGNLEAFSRMKAVEDIDASDKPVVQAVWFLFNYAFDQRASDIHIEPKRETSEVRLRIDGVLHRIHVMPKAVHRAVISRVKTLARMDIAEQRRPQDGRIKTNFKDAEIELRVSTVPTAFGEKVVIRVFDPEVLMQEVGSLGMFANEQEQYEGFVARTNGLVLVTGPTGSGKTTTLYSTLSYLHSPQVNITTIEDPIEMVREEFNQIAVHPRIGLTFATALRNILRQDPDIVMVGEVRDKETADNAIQAALTGHLVLSTLHTNDTATSITRLLDLGVLPFLLSSVCVGVVAQRLVRTVCKNCKVDTLLTRDQILNLDIKGAEGRKLKISYGEGCARCRGTGYDGRTGVFEVMPINDKIRQLIVAQRSAEEIKRESLSEGMVTLRDYAIKKMAMGLTTYEEVLRVTTE
ncbi:MAG: type II/IV secretion system protein [Deltaproteobacteria bacterium]|nr:type II/IV secretion system protein [Deltaproteobacteria bacterium]